ncbi:hypothetical protein C1S80_30035 [Mycolicibacterium aubagnense]|nr:hypothetical protein C1S80_30035 [Mycolicibacterium aubagnense]
MIHGNVGPVAGIDWSKALDFEKAVSNVRSEFVGDWHRDPWGWPEIDYIASTAQELLVEHLKSNRIGRAALIDVPKENWGVRPAVVLNIVDRLVYQALVDRVSVDLIGDLSPSVYGWRLPPGSTERGGYSQNSLQWDAYRDHLSGAAGFFEVGLRTDLVSCFASMPVDLVLSAIDERVAQGAVSRRLLSLIDGMSKMPGRSGLPQRSLASAVVANMYLQPLDDVLEQYSHDVPSLDLLGSKRKSPRRSWTRWMDDVWLFGGDASDLRRAQLELQSVARSIGMNINSAKTEVLDGEDLYEAALQIEHSAVDDALLTDKDAKPLEELVDRLLDDPARAPRTSLKFAALRMRKHNSHYRIQEFAQLAHQMPHAADALTPLFKLTFTQSSLQDWFLDYAKSGWGSLQWSVAQYLHLFPSESRPRKALRDYVTTLIADSDTSISLLAVAAQRLCAWDPQAARAALRQVAVRTDHPQSRRIVALACLAADERRTTVRKWLAHDDDNRVTLDMLESRKFATPEVNKAYAR